MVVRLSLPGYPGGMQKHAPRYCACGNVVPRTDMVHCSGACYHNSRRGKPREALKRRIQKICPVCGTKFEAGGRSGRKKHVIYCSERCAQQARRVPIDQARHPNGCATWEGLSAKIIKRDEACIFCGRTKNLQAHHKVPREYGGGHEEENLGAACRRCHMVVDAMIKIMKTKNPDFDIQSWLSSFMEGA